MDYKLAKQLKDAGFPQDNPESEYVEDKKDGKVVLPTLSELIDACGEDFGSLINLGNQWLAESNYVEKPNGVGSAVEKTPEKSVAKLWLKLIKKENI